MASITHTLDPVKDGLLRKELASLELEMKINENEKSTNSNIMQLVLKEIISHISKLDAFYAEMFRDIKFSGSFYEGLRIKEATEFDLNIILAFPKIPKSEIKIETDGCPESFAKLKINTQLEKIKGTKLDEEAIRQYKKLMDKDFDQYILGLEVKKLLKSLLFQTLSNIRVPGVAKITYSESGPACTIYIHTISGVKIDVDLVPVFRFLATDFPLWPGIENNQIAKIRASGKFFFLVPKGYIKAVRQNSREPKTNDFPKLWRVHFPDEENSLLHDRKFAKPLIKLLKLLRDEENWKQLASYFMKTVVLHEIKKYNNREDWQDKNSGKRFIGALQSLQTYAEKEKLPHVMFSSFNLFQNIVKDELNKIKNRIPKILKLIADDPTELRVKFFKSTNGACAAKGCL